MFLFKKKEFDKKVFCNLEDTCKILNLKKYEVVNLHESNKLKGVKSDNDIWFKITEVNAFAMKNVKENKTPLKKEENMDQNIKSIEFVVTQIPNEHTAVQEPWFTKRTTFVNGDVHDEPWASAPDLDRLFDAAANKWDNWNLQTVIDAVNNS
jgi:hypothetical protein